MRYVTFIAAIFMILVSCNKSASPATSDAEALNGRWTYKQRYYSIGGPLIYEDAAQPNQFMYFKADGSFQSDMQDFKEYKTYTIVDSISLKFSPKSTTSPFQQYRYSFKENGELELSPINPVCFEGCGVILKK